MNFFNALLPRALFSKLQGPSRVTGCTILGKCEYENPVR